ncbi:F-box protein At1g70590 [Cynara cardunculus var. scolymus]|uniref:F-box domain, cyclin-like protein n=1 Tax=Cynara cardunculus var. scolymus TaxID=59895 RepID=A0A103YB06_CYNCS|nr:F-box protein At1g70590 [Cynara cardunculus var. scolymus]KVI05772.1 F-box domain, cyclin-like protein [Cynara cardunculus var. scolymus]
MSDRTWPNRSEASHFLTLPFPIKNPIRKHENTSKSTGIQQFRPSSSSRRSDQHRDFAALPNDVLTKIAANFSLPHLQTASLVCKSWRDGLRPLREAMLFLRWGKRFKHGRGGVKPNLEKALESFLKGAARGSTLAMVDAGLVYWEMGKKEEGVALYRKAAELGDPAAQCNLGISYLQAEPPNMKEAVKWLYQASVAGYVRGQYQLALCLHRGGGMNQNMSDAARWYLRAAEGGYVRAMYNVSLCYSLGMGVSQNHRQSRKWMKHAADHGHKKAQFEHGLALFSEGQMMKAVVYLELAGRGGETAAAHVKNVILQQLSPPSRERAFRLADTWRALPSSR